MSELEKKIKEYANSYYSGEEQISDSEYDALIEQLRKENPNSELLQNGVIGSDLKGVSKKYKLPVTMGTLSKCMTNEEFNEWWNKHSHDVMCQVKVDGAGCLLEYKNGKFVFAYSRGDSEFGEDLTNNVSKITNFPKTLKTTDFTGYIRGEIVLKRETFEKYFSKNMANPRNATAGILKRLDGKDCEKLSFIGYDVFDNTGISSSEQNKIDFLQNEEFEVPKWWQGATYEDIIDLKDSIPTFKKDLGYDIDGIVLKQNKTDKNDLARKTPLNNCAVKPNREIEVTKVKKIVWQLSGRYLAPVVEVEPVELNGTTVSRASVSNICVMNELGIYEGADVEICKSGEIIPIILKVLNPKKNSFEVPDTCPVCGGKIVVNNSGFPECVNEICPRKVGHRFKKMFKIFGIKGAGDSFVSSLENAGITIEDFLEMISNNDEKVLNKYAGGINGEKIYKQMKNIGEITPSKFLALFDVRLFDEKKLNQLGNKSLDEMINLTKEEILNINGFSDITADAYIKFIKNNKDEISSLRKYFTIKNPSDIMKEKGEEKMSKIAGKSFCFTGKACKPRNELENIVVNNGGTFKTSVTKDLDYLVTDDQNSGSSKNKKAAELGIPVISSIDFLMMAAQ